MEIFERSGSDIPPEVRKAALPLLDDIDYQKYQRQPDIGLWRGEKIIEFCGTAAIPKLLELLKSDDTVLRKWAVSAGRNMRGPVAREKLLPL